MTPTKSFSHKEYLKKKRRKKILKYGAIIFFIAFLIGLDSYLFHRPEARITKVELNGGVLVEQEDLEQKSLEYMQGSYLWLFPKNNIFIYPHDDLEKYLKSNFKRIDTIDIHLGNLKTLVVDITERKPVAIWCSESDMLMASSTEGGESEVCYFMDDESTIFAEAPNFSGDAYFKYYGLLVLSDGESPIGKQYIASSTVFKEISSFVENTKKLAIEPVYLLAKDNNEFTLTLFNGGEIYFNLGEPLSTTEQNLEALLRTPALASSTGNLPIEYIDLRYNNKLFYKLKTTK